MFRLPADVIPAHAWASCPLGVLKSLLVCELVAEEAAARASRAERLRPFPGFQAVGAAPTAGRLVCLGLRAEG